ncbi:tetratricopeptide repeat protein [Streptomyces rochei]|uniref:Tetratricopeptide repeat protein n=1 Tax=Streptomyces rochei TaxID=1928 RepID=A0AAX3ZBV4_STRRO|nr:tetratricopeptide repeat protein [Streptomyces rochei]WMC84412.1 tetratricopeptide repeat protein [Streptomyces rochei]
MVRWGKRRRSAGKETAATTDATTSVSDTGDATAGPGATSVTGYLGGRQGDASGSVHVSGTGNAQAGPGGFASTGPIIGSRITIGPGRPYRLERFSFAPTVDDQALPRVFADQPSRLLDARSQIVPFSGRQEELTRLAEWRDAGTASLSALLLHGPGGEGKTRLSARFAALSAEAGWQVVEACHRDSPRPRQEEPVPADGRGLLVIVDYADRWAHPELVELLRDPLLAGPAVRVLLIGRTVQWWAAVRGELRSVGAAVTDLPLREFAADVTDRERAFVAARDRFGAVLGVSEPITEVVRGLDTPPYAQVLTLHMAALVTALAAGRPGSPVPESVEEIAAYLLDRERMGWRRLYGSRLAGEEFDTPPTVMARAVFTAVLAGPASYAEGVGRLDGLGLRAADRVVTDHRFCYPPLDRAQVLEPLRPDRLAEDLVALLIPGHDVSGYDPDPWTASVPRTLLAADRPDLPVPAFANRAVTVLASAADRWPHVGAELGSLIRQRPEIAVGAGSAALVALSHARYVDTDVLLEVEMRLPQQRQADLDVGAAAVTERLVRERVDDTTRLQDAASWYARLGVRLAHAGRKNEAVRANHQALAALHRLDELVPQTYGTHVALCLMDIGGYQSDLGRHKEAVGFTRRAIDLLREQVREGHREARPQLALALANYGNQLQNTGQRGDAVEAAGESVARYRELAGSDLADPPRLAFALCGLGTRLLAVGRNEDAAEALVESVAGYRELVAAAPQTHLPGLARALTNLGTARQRLGQRGEAVRAAEESVRIRRDLVELNGQAHTADLATSLLNYAGRLADVDEDEEAVARAEEAVKLARRLWRTDRLAHEALLANALASQGAVLARAARGGAAASLREAITLYERLVTVDDGHRTALHTARHNLGVLEADDGPDGAPATEAEPDDEAVHTYNEGVRLARAGSSEQARECYRRAAEAGLPQAMFNLGNMCWEDGNAADAKLWWTRAVTAGSLEGCFNLGVLHWKQGDRDMARHWFRRGAEAGATNAMTSLGAALWSDGDLAAAERWFRAAAEAGDPDGDHRLGLLLDEQGRHDEAGTGFERAAEAGHAEAARSLADHRMRHGRLTDAHRWWRLDQVRQEPQPPSPPESQPEPVPVPEPGRVHPLVEAASDQGIPVQSLQPAQMVELAGSIMDGQVAKLVGEGRLEDAVALYREQAAGLRRLLSSGAEGRVPMSAAMTYRLLQQHATYLAAMAPLELALGHVDQALAHSEEAVTALGALAARGGDLLPHAWAQYVFAAIRADAGTDTERALRAVEEAIQVLGRPHHTPHEQTRQHLSKALAVQATLLRLR